jgi:creatinine amidohydrolase
VNTRAPGETMDRHQSEGPRKSARGSIGAKLALAGIAGVLIALFVVQQPLTQPLPNTLQIADMTWVEVRSAMRRGYTRVIVPSGGIEQNGPHMVLGKHDYIVGWSANEMAKQLGQTLVAPVVSYVPEGDYDPPTGHLRFPGTIGISEQAYGLVLEGIARSLKAGGFKTICLIADHAGSLKTQSEVAKRLTQEWAAQGVKVLDVSDYYADAAETAFLKSLGESEDAIGQHAGIADTSELMSVRPEGVDLSRIPLFASEPTGVSGDPSKATNERGRSLLNIKILGAIRQIRALEAGI